MLIQNWEEEIEKLKISYLCSPEDLLISVITRHLLPHSLRCFKYHGYSRKVELPELLKHDVIITTYGTIAAECNRKQSKLHRVNWFRIVLDEGEMKPSTIKPMRLLTTVKLT